MMRIGTVVVLVAAMAACTGRGGLFRDYEYEEELYLSIDGRATIYVNSSVAALVALRGAPFETKPNAPVDRAAVRTYFGSRAAMPNVADSPDLPTSAKATVGPPPGEGGKVGPTDARVAPVTTSRRHGRPFVHVRVDIDDVRHAGELAPLAWSSYQLEKKDDSVAFQQTVGAASGDVVARPNWNGSEYVSFRLHLPSRIQYHNSPSRRVERGNILEWEQSLSDRLRGVPLTLEVRMEASSILFRTLSLFAATIVAVALMFGAIIWWIRRDGERRPS